MIDIFSMFFHFHSKKEAKFPKQTKRNIAIIHQSLPIVVTIAWPDVESNSYMSMGVTSVCIITLIYFVEQKIILERIELKG